MPDMIAPRFACIGVINFVCVTVFYVLCTIVNQPVKYTKRLLNCCKQILLVIRLFIHRKKFIKPLQIDKYVFILLQDTKLVCQTLFH